jgi:hypothetical protein
LRSYRFWRLATLVSLLALLACACQPTTIKLTVEGEKGALSIAVPANDIIQLTFMHSVELSPVVESYRVEPGGLVMVETRSRTFGWGLPSSEPGYHQIMVDNQTWFAFSLERKVGELRVITDAVNDYTLNTGGVTVKLADFGRSVRIATGH